MERKMSLDVSEFMDRNIDDVAKCQAGFIQFIVFPIFELLWIYQPEFKFIYSDNLKKNLEFWRLDTWKDANEEIIPLAPPKTCTFVLLCILSASHFSEGDDTDTTSEEDESFKIKGSLSIVRSRASSLGELPNLLDRDSKVHVRGRSTRKQRRVSASFY
eukprot:maker-scaffold_43-snap-gene-1.40-mRNA-1 protein AED:0.69 eAED:0.69 QI:0/0/0/0.66/1/1/3/0/158